MARSVARAPAWATAWPLRTHLVGAVLCAMLPGVIVACAAAKYSTRSFVYRYDEAQLRIASTLAASFNRRIDALSDLVAATVGWDLAQLAEAPDLALPRQHIARYGDSLRLCAVLWRQGSVLARTGSLGDERCGTGPDAAMAAFHAAKTGQREIGVPSDADGVGRAPMFIMVPLPASASAGGVLQISLSSARMSDLLSSGAARSDVALRLVGPRGEVLGDPEMRDTLGIAGLDERLAATLDRRGMGAAELQAPGAPPVLLAYATLPSIPGWRLVLIGPAPSQLLRWAMPLTEFLVAIAASVLLAVGIAIWLASRLARPLAALTAESSTLAASGDLMQIDTAPCIGVREFEELAANLRRSTAVLRRRAAAERMALQEARTGHELLASFVTATEDLIYVKNLDLRLVMANSATLALGGVARNEWQVLGHHIDVVLPPEAAAEEEALDRRVVAGGESERLRLEWRDDAGRMLSFLLTKSLWRDGSGQISGTVTVAHDVTDERAAEARLAATQADLLRVSRLSAMGAMASGLAHELNQPLAAAANFLNAAGRLFDGPSSESGLLNARADRMARSAIGDAAEQMLRAGDIVRRLRAFVGRGEAALRLEDVGDVIREACELAVADGAVGSAELVVLEAGLGEVALLDRTQLQQVLLNLVRNAAEALGDTAGARIEIACKRMADGAVRITVGDNGPGLAPEVSQRLFQPFVSTKRDGMGIGLAICRTIVEGHGGRLSAAPRPQGGTTFTIVLPAMRAGYDGEAVHAA